MDRPLREFLAGQIAGMKEAGTFKEERILSTPQAATIGVAGREVLNFCANNYLGLSSHPELVAAAHRGLDQRGYGMSSVRFICGTQDRHRVLEQTIAAFFGLDDAILYSSCFDANGGLFETLLGEEDAVISDELNHASIIDGVRLCKARRHRYRHGDMADLAVQLEAVKDARHRMIATDGVFSMDGDVAPLPQICELADRFGAIVMVDDSHATGFIGRTGRGTAEHHGVLGRVDILTSTLGKALGGALGGFTAARQEVVTWLRNRSRPYLFSNSLPPPVVEASICAFELLAKTTELRDRLEANTKHFRGRITEAGFQIKPGFTPIVPIMLGDARLAGEMAKDLLVEGIYVIGFSFPVVPKGQARIRVQISAGHTREHLDRAVEGFTKIGKKHGVIR
ncbi:MAG: glycine C-acetyltransferase [Candidatus Brocadiae bacterium]|nr:glycine C-acetyltransferase [Candidatus Brocadiia bacterium]